MASSHLACSKSCFQIVLHAQRFARKPAFDDHDGMVQKIDEGR
jgi:hypothetical protein